jgi:hypothetical protein
MIEMGRRSNSAKPSAIQKNSFKVKKDIISVDSEDSENEGAPLNKELEVIREEGRESTFK